MEFDGTCEGPNGVRPHIHKETFPWNKAILAKRSALVYGCAARHADDVFEELFRSFGDPVLPRRSNPASNRKPADATTVDRDLPIRFNLAVISALDILYREAPAAAGDHGL